MRVVTGNKYPNDRWIVVDDDDKVIFDPAYSAGDHSMTLKVCNIYVNMPEHRDELHEKFGKRTDYGWDNLGYFV
jgi:hypothetical protein